jgi:two-component system response regulator AtoC
MTAPVYIVDDDASVRDAVGGLVRSGGWKVESFASAQEFLASPWADVPSCLILDLQLPGMSGLDLQQRLAKSRARTSIIFLTAHGDIPTSVRAIRAGALEFLTKPYAGADLLTAIERGLEYAGRQSEEAPRRAEWLDAPIQSTVGGREAGRPAIGQSAAWRDVLRKATQVAATETIVLLQGESGTGKEVVARFIHRASPRQGGPFVAINCAALPDHLLESELFGYERGAFTGAQRPKPGQIELAYGGVLFLDEVTEMTAAAQAKLLRVLQEREFQRLGGTHLLRANVRVIAATNRDLRDAVARGAFREDLYYRLHVFDIQMPPLRERTRDIPLLVDAFLLDIGRAIGRAPAGVAPEAKDMLMKHAWPGNVRELRNALERAAILCEGGLITPAHLSLHAEPIAISFDAATDLRSAERRAIDKALRETDGNKAKAARRLGLSRTQLYGRLRKYQIPEAARCGATPERVNCLRRSGDLHLDSENWVDASSNDS